MPAQSHNLVYRDDMPSHAKKVLIVDDNRENRYLAGLMLEMLGYAHENVSGGLEALDRITHSHYDVVLMDVQMPVVDGLETTRRIRAYEKDHKLPPMPIIAMTADAARIFESECRDAGMDGFIIKPYTSNRLAQMIEPYLH